HAPRQPADRGLAAAGRDLPAVVAGRQEREGLALARLRPRLHLGRGRRFGLARALAAREKEKAEDAPRRPPARHGAPAPGCRSDPHFIFISARLAFARFPASWPEVLGAASREAVACFFMLSLSKHRPTWSRASGRKRLFGQVSRTCWYARMAAR